MVRGVINSWVMLVKNCNLLWLSSSDFLRLISITSIFFCICIRFLPIFRKIATIRAMIKT